MSHLGTISLDEIRKQINNLTLQTLQKYSKILETEDNEKIEKFLYEETEMLGCDTGIMVLQGDSFKVFTQVKGLNLYDQYTADRLCRALEYRLRDEERRSVFCSVSQSGKEIEFWYDD